MLRRTYLVFLFLSMSFMLFAQVKPREGDTVNYRMVGFIVPQKSDVANYKLEIANGIINNNVDFNKSIAITTQNATNRIIATVPQFGKSYTWRVSYLNKKDKAKEQSQLYHFTTGNPEIVDTSKNRFRVLNKADHHKDLLMFLDYSKALYDMEGNPVWYLPNINGLLGKDIAVRDLKLTEAGTVTFLSPLNAYEIDYDGNIIFGTKKDPDSVGLEQLEEYHHEFVKLGNGHYMVAGNEFTFVQMHTDTTKIPKRGGPMFKIVDGKPYRKVPIGTIEEYDAKWNKVWEWKSFDKIKNDTFFIKPQVFPEDVEPHMNSFYFDEKQQVIYVSFRNANHILKIRYPSGEVIAKYNGSLNEPPMFCGQHAVRLNKEGNIILFNNNLRFRKYTDQVRSSYISEFKEVNDSTLSPVWNFSCNIDTYTKPSTPAGGNVLELADGCYISCVGLTGRNFIVNRDKKLIWNALIEKKDETLNTWQPTEEYRVNIIETKAELEKFVFSNINP